MKPFFVVEYSLLFGWKTREVEDLRLKRPTESMTRDIDYLYYMNQKYWIVAWFPHPDIPVKNNSIYKDSASEASLKVISSI